MSMLRERWRRATGIYLALFFLAVAGAPHAHVNGLEDLLLDEPSDSGEIAEIDALCVATDGPGWYTERLIEDDPCLACFNSDFVSTPAPILTFTPHLERFEAPPPVRVERAPRAVLRGRPSRAPPRLS